MILVTGGGGLLGSHLIAELLLKGQSPKVLIRNNNSKIKILKLIALYTNEADKLFKNIIWAEGDITDRVSLYNAMEGVKFVYHCAAKVSFDRHDRKEMLETNIRGTANIVDACLELGIKKLVHVSSVAAVKSNPESEIITEDAGWPDGHTPNYSYSKTRSEFEVWRGITEGLNAVIINPSVILGPGDWNSGSPRFFSTVNNGLKFYTRGITGFVDVLDVVKIMVQLMETDIHSQRFILNAENISYEELFRMIAHSLGIKGPTIYASPEMTKLGRFIDLIKSTLFFSKPMITKETAKAAHSKQYYSSEKLVSTISFSFTPLKTTIEKVAKQFLLNSKQIQIP